MKRKILKGIAIIFLIITVIIMAYAIYCALYFFDIVPNKNLGILDISLLVAGYSAGAGTVTGLIAFLFYKCSKRCK